MSNVEIRMTKELRMANEEGSMSNVPSPKSQVPNLKPHT